MDVRPINPFIIGGPVPASKFIGRREQVNTILSQLANPESRGSSAINGERRIGKTSLLHYIASTEAATKYGLSHSQFSFVFVDTQTLGSYMDSQNIEVFSETVFWHYILRPLSMYQLLGAEYARKLLEQEKVGANDLIPLFVQVAAQDKVVVLLLDEFEWIIDNIDPQSPTLLYVLRALLHRPVSERGLALITSSEEPLSVVCKDINFIGSPFPPSLVPVHLGPFPSTEAYELIDEYLKGTAVAFRDEDKELAYNLSEGHPYWLQRACFAMFNRYREHPGMLSELDRRAIASEIWAELADSRGELKAATKERPIIGAVKRLVAKFNKTALVFLLLALLSLCWLIPDFSDLVQAEVLGKANETPIVGLYNSKGEEIQATIYSPRLLRMGASETIQIVSHDPEKPDISVIPQPQSGIVATRDKDDPTKFTTECKDTSPGLFPINWTEYRQVDIVATMPITGSLPVTTIISVKTNYVFSLIAKLLLFISGVIGSLATLAERIKKIPALFRGDTGGTQATS